MSLEALKQKIIATVNASEDEMLLQDILEILYNPDLNEKETYYYHRLKESIQQSDGGKVITAERVHQMVKQRVLACTKSLNEAWEDDERRNAFLKD